MAHSAKCFTNQDVVNGAAYIKPTFNPYASNYTYDPLPSGVQTQHIAIPSGLIFQTLDGRFLVDPSGWSH